MSPRRAEGCKDCHQNADVINLAATQLSPHDQAVS